MRPCRPCYVRENSCAIFTFGCMIKSLIDGEMWCLNFYKFCHSFGAPPRTLDFLNLLKETYLHADIRKDADAVSGNFQGIYWDP